MLATAVFDFRLFVMDIHMELCHRHLCVNNSYFINLRSIVFQFSIPGLISAHPIPEKSLKLQVQTQLNAWFLPVVLYCKAQNNRGLMLQFNKTGVHSITTLL